MLHIFFVTHCNVRREQPSIKKRGRHMFWMGKKKKEEKQILIGGCCDILEPHGMANRKISLDFVLAFKTVHCFLVT